MSFFFLIKPYRRWIFLTLVCIFLTNILALFLPWGIKMILDDVLRTRDIHLLRMILAGLFIILILRTGLNFSQKYLSSMIGERIVGDLRKKLYEHIHRLAVTDIQVLSPSQILPRITGDVDSIRRFIFGDALDFIYAIFGALGIIILLVWINPRLTWISLTTLPFFMLVYVHFLPELKGRYVQLRDAYGKLTSRISEVLNGITTVHAFGGESYEQMRFSDSQSRVLKVADKTHSLNTALWISVEFFTSVGILSVLWIGGEDVIASRMTPGALVAFYSYLGMLFTPLIRMVIINSSYQEASAALDRIENILSMKSGPAEEGTPVVLSCAKGGSVTFTNVSFCYTPHQRTLNHVTFTIDPGEVVGIIGPSGAGKSTLVGLLLRFFDPEEGQIFINGEDLRRLDLKAYRHSVAVVLQDDFLFQGSVFENICYGMGHTVRADAAEAARLAEAHDFITALPQGYDTLVGERGVLLSCGQRQRIAIARALIRKPAILILDEATSALDAMMENTIQKAIKGQDKERTVFIVAHRFSTIMDVDKIIVLEDGHLVDAGTHDVLLKRCAFYRHLYEEQFKVGDEG